MEEGRRSIDISQYLRPSSHLPAAQPLVVRNLIFNTRLAICEMFALPTFTNLSFRAYRRQTRS
jgi:hypothetical protein